MLVYYWLWRERNWERETDLKSGKSRGSRNEAAPARPLSLPARGHLRCCEWPRGETGASHLEAAARLGQGSEKLQDDPAGPGGLWARLLPRDDKVAPQLSYSMCALHLASPHQFLEWQKQKQVVAASLYLPDVVVSLVTRADLELNRERNSGNTVPAWLSWHNANPLKQREWDASLTVFPLPFCPVGAVATPLALTHIANTTVLCYRCLSFKEVNRWEVTRTSSLCPLLLSFVQVSIQSNRLSLQEIPLLFSCSAGLRVTDSLRFCFSFVKKLFPFHFLKGIVAGHKILGWQFFSFSFSALERFHCLLLT